MACFLAWRSSCLPLLWRQGLRSYATGVWPTWIVFLLGYLVASGMFMFVCVLSFGKFLHFFHFWCFFGWYFKFCKKGCRHGYFGPAFPLSLVLRHCVLNSPQKITINDNLDIFSPSFVPPKNASNASFIFCGAAFEDRCCVIPSPHSSPFIPSPNHLKSFNPQKVLGRDCRDSSRLVTEDPRPNGRPLEGFFGPRIKWHPELCPQSRPPPRS